MTDKYAVIGNPISHSKSPLIHKMFAAQTGEDISYEAIEAPIDVRFGFEDKIEELINNGYKGCNVTVPFKQRAFQLRAASSTFDVLEAHAANTLKFTPEGIQLHNTDGIGLIRDIESNLRVNVHGKRILLMGAGGAASGVLVPLNRAGTIITIVNRTADKAKALAASQTSTKVFGYGYEEITDQQFDIVINATSAGLSDSEVPLPDGIFSGGALAYDMMYGRETPFMAFARSQGATVADGLGMLVEQAAEAFYIWRGVRPDTKPVIAALRG